MVDLEYSPPRSAYGPFWGVDSVTHIDHKVDAKGTKTLFDYVTEKAGGVAPYFWGRYIGGHYAIQSSEINYLAGASDRLCRILPIYNGMATTTFLQGYQTGYMEADKAVKAGNKAGVPRHVCIYGNIEPSKSTGCNPEWFRGWWDRMGNSEYFGCGGLYFDCNDSRIVQALKKALIKTGRIKGGDDDETIPVGAAGRILYYSCRERSFGHKSITPIPSNFSPKEPNFLTGTATLWQYALSCLGGLIDCDMASDDGYDAMWYV